MGSHCSIQLYATCRAEFDEVSQRVEAEIARIESRYSRYLETSFLAAINRSARQAETIRVDAETARLIDYAYACHAKSGGLFDITSGRLRRVWDFGREQAISDMGRLKAELRHVGMHRLAWNDPELGFEVPGMELDLGGIVKEYAADQAAAICRAGGVSHGLVELGGDIAVIGPHPDGSDWIVGVQHPVDRDALLMNIGVGSGGVATSGDYERYIELDGRRYSHLLNPITGWPVHGLVAVTVVAQHCLLAGSLATIAMLKGAEGAAWLGGCGVGYLCVDVEGQVSGNLLA